MSSLGENIRQVRKKRKMSQQELARKIEVTSGFLSQIENGKNAPSLVTLKKLAGSLGVSVGYLMGEEEQKSRLMVRARERYRMDDFSEGKRCIEYLTDVDAQSSVEVSIHTLRPLGQSGSPNSVHEGQEVWLLLEGSVQISVDSQAYIMSVGDCYYIKDCTVPHTYVNLSSTQEARMLCVATPQFAASTALEREIPLGL